MTELEFQLLNTGNLAQRIVTSGSITYIAKAEAGTKWDEEKWQALRIDETDANDVRIAFADGNLEFDNTAASLASLSYYTASV